MRATECRARKLLAHTSDFYWQHFLLARCVGEHGDTQPHDLPRGADEGLNVVMNALFQATKLKPDWALAYNDMGLKFEYWQERGQMQRSAELLSLAISLDPASGIYAINLGSRTHARTRTHTHTRAHIYIHTHMHIRMERMFQHIHAHTHMHIRQHSYILTQPWRATYTHTYIAMAYHHMGKIADAAAMSKRAAKLQPNNAQVQEQLGRGNPSSNSNPRPPTPQFPRLLSRGLSPYMPRPSSCTS